MSYHPLINGVDQRRSLKNEYSLCMPLSDKQMTTAQIYKKADNAMQHSGNSAHSSKAKYHFTYGQPYIQPAFGQQTTKSINHQVINGIDNHLRNINNQNINQAVYSSMSPGLQRSRTQSIKKKRLKIFPEKFQKNVTIAVKQQKLKQKPKQIEQISQLKDEIHRLRQQIHSLSLNLSKNTSRDFTESIYRNQVQRTKRLSQLNEFNQKLYNQLAVKLKQISLQEYDNYLESNQSNKKFLESVFSSAQKQRQYQTFDYGSIPAQHKFMDIQDFEKEYQEKYSQKGESPHKDMKKMFQQQNQQLESPFLMKENTFVEEKLQPVRADQFKKTQKNQAFTFHKQKRHRQRHLSKALYQKVNKPLVLDPPADQTLKAHNKNQVIQNQQKAIIDNNKHYQRKLFDVEKHSTQKRQIHDFNRQLENKIMKKRCASEYAYFSRTRRF